MSKSDKVVSFTINKLSPFDRSYIARPKNKLKNSKMVCLCKRTDNNLSMRVYIFRSGNYELILRASISNRCDCEYKFSAKSKNKGFELVTLLEPSYAMGMIFAVAEKEFFADDKYDEYRSKEDIEDIYKLFHKDYRIEEELGNVQNKYSKMAIDRKIG